MESQRLFQLNDIVRDRVSQFLHAVGKRFAASRQQSINACVDEIIRIIDQPSLSDLAILKQLTDHICMEHDTKPKQKRPATRVADLEEEWKRIQLITYDAFTYIDIGCSEGSITEAVSDALYLDPHHTFACDIISIPMENKPFQFSLNTTTVLPYQTESMNLATMFMSAHHFSDVHAMFNETYRILRPGGYLIMREHCAETMTDKETNATYYNIFHAIYACTQIAKSQREQTPEAFMNEFQSSREYATYRSSKEWIDIANMHQFELIGKPHGPLSWHSKQGKQRQYVSDPIFDAMYFLFRVKK